VIFSDSLSKEKPSKSFMTVYTNDTLVRIESESMQLGKQVLIKHLILGKYYILLEFNAQKFAIQHQVKPDSTASKYTFKKKFGKKKFANLKAKKLEVKLHAEEKEQTIYYLKGINPNYIDAMNGIPGLAAEYFLQTQEGVFTYKLIHFSEETVNKDLFGIPKEYQKVSFDEFIEQMMVPRIHETE
jgi:hypothetical protein